MTFANEIVSIYNLAISSSIPIQPVFRIQPVTPWFELLLLSFVTILTYTKKTAQLQVGKRDLDFFILFISFVEHKRLSLRAAGKRWQRFAYKPPAFIKLTFYLNLTNNWHKKNKEGTMIALGDSCLPTYLSISNLFSPFKNTSAITNFLFS